MLVDARCEDASRPKGGGGAYTQLYGSMSDYRCLDRKSDANCLRV